jgi:uncharacterized protein YukE
MSQVIVSPEELRKFSAELKRFNSDLKNDATRLHARFRQLGETWRDQEHKKFEVEFTQTAKVIQHFVQAAELYVSFLIRKAEAAEAFLKRR